MHDIPARPPRDQRLDIVRGWLQLSIFATHAGGTFIGGWCIHAAWGFSDSSELFVFLSGFTLGSVFAYNAARGGWRVGTIDLLRRTRRLYRMHLLVLLLFGVMVAVAGATILPGEVTRLRWDFLAADPVRAVPGLLSMLYQPEFMGILPVFVWCMLLLPGFVAAQRRWGGAALLLPVSCYAAVWAFGLAMPSLQPGGNIQFNPFAWQVLFLIGAWLGRRALLQGEALPFRAAWARAALWAAFAVLAAGLLMRLTWYGFTPWPAPLGELTWIEGKENLAPPRLLHAMALAFVVAALVPRDAPWMHRALPRAVARIGQYSLEVFCLGLFLSWAASAVFRLAPAHGVAFAVEDVALIGLGGVLLARFAALLDRRRTSRRGIETANGAQEKTRTSTTLRPQVPETCASTNSATWAGAPGNDRDSGRPAI